MNTPLEAHPANDSEQAIADRYFCSAYFLTISFIQAASYH
jgi:hypothetical protein